MTVTKKPILFLIFNRPETTQEVFNQIKKYKPKQLFIGSDGPRKHKSEEILIVENLRSGILKQIDWECDVLTNFQDENLGCKLAVYNSINWFFENVESGIILEDDCKPTMQFFDFCSYHLDQYNKTSNVMMITGTNYFIDLTEKMKYSHYFSRSYTIWGLATWKSAWETYDLDMQTWKNGDVKKNDLKYLSNKNYVLENYICQFNEIIENRIDTWDIQWVYNCITHSGLCVTPAINMVSNIGVDCTHTSGEVTDSHFMETPDKKLTFEHNNIIIPNIELDRQLHRLKTRKAYYEGLFVRIVKKTFLFKIYKFIK